MQKRTVWIVALAVCLGGCSGRSGDRVAVEPSPGASFPFANALLDNGERSTLVLVEVAETPAQQERGLSGRTSLAEDEGMVFVFFEEREAGVPMEDVSIPLSIAFFDAGGTIVKIVDTDPCTNDPCPEHAPGTPYMGALAVNQGSFEEWDISEGDHLQLTR